MLRKGSLSCLQEMPQGGNSLHVQPSSISWLLYASTISNIRTHELELTAVLLCTASLQKSKQYSRDTGVYFILSLYACPLVYAGVHWMQPVRNLSKRPRITQSVCGQSLQPWVCRTPSCTRTWRLYCLNYFIAFYYKSPLSRQAY